MDGVTPVVALEGAEGVAKATTKSATKKVAVKKTAVKKTAVKKTAVKKTAVGKRLALTARAKAIKAARAIGLAGRWLYELPLKVVYQIVRLWRAIMAKCRRQVPVTVPAS